MKYPHKKIIDNIKSCFHELFINFKFDYYHRSTRNHPLRPGPTEILFIIIIISLFPISYYFPIFKPSLKELLVIIMLLWSALALFGFLTPSVYHLLSFGQGDFRNKPDDTFMVYIFMITSGGFICHNPIDLYAYIRVMDFKMNKFKKYSPPKDLNEVSILFEGSFNVKKKTEGGGIKIDLKKGFGKGTILYTSPGSHDLLFFHNNSWRNLSDVKLPLHGDYSVKISPPETIHPIRLGNISYGLSIIVLCIAIISFF